MNPWLFVGLTQDQLVRSLFERDIADQVRPFVASRLHIMSVAISKPFRLLFWGCTLP